MKKMSSELDEGLLPNSKTIKKTKSSSSKREKTTTARKYKTYKKEVKAKILSELHKELVLLVMTQNFDKIDFAEVSEKLELIELIEMAEDDYDLILKKVVLKYDFSLNEDSKWLAGWRKKILNWMRSAGKPETRGGVLVADKNMGFFLSELRLILSSLEKRSFDDLQQKIISVLEEIHLKDGKSLDSFDRNICSKHWWFDFIEKQPDIKILWRSLKIARKSKYQKAERETYVDTNLSDFTSIFGSPIQSPLFSTICNSPVYLPELTELTIDEMVEETLRITELLKTLYENQEERDLLSEDTVSAFDYLQNL